MPVPLRQPNEQGPETNPILTGWVKPTARYVTLPGGVQVRVFVCNFCRDSGLVHLPKYTEDEDDRRLLHGPREVPYFCPTCREDDARFRLFVPAADRHTRQQFLPDFHYARLMRWATLRGRQLDEDAMLTEGEQAERWRTARETVRQFLATGLKTAPDTPDHSAISDQDRQTLRGNAAARERQLEAERRAAEEMADWNTPRGEDLG